MLAHQDSIDTTAAEAGPGTSRRGGRRPGAGAPKGNLNAFKHGRYSRLRHLLDAPAAVDPHGRHPAVARGARRRVEEEQRAAEHATAAVFAAARHAQYLRARAEAVINGRPMPPPTLTPLDRDHFEEFKAIGVLVSGHIEEERLRAAGRIRPDNPGVAEDLRLAEQIERLLPAVVDVLERAAVDTPTAAELLALVPPAGFNQRFNQTEAAVSDSAGPVQSTDPDSQSPNALVQRQSNAPDPNGPPPLPNRRVS